MTIKSLKFSNVLRPNIGPLIDPSPLEFILDLMQQVS